MLAAGETDFLNKYGAELLESCVEPVVIHHPKGHTIPRLGTLLSYYIFIFVIYLYSYAGAQIGSYFIFYSFAMKKNDFVFELLI